MKPTVFFSLPNMSVPLRLIPIHRYKLGTEYVEDLDVVATEAVFEAKIACDQAGWLQISSDGGGSYDPLLTDASTGVDLGALGAGSRTPVKLKVSIASGVRRKFVEIIIGVGT